MIGTGTMAQAEIQDKIIEVIGLEEALGGITDKIVERDIEMKGLVITTMEIEIDQGREHLQEFSNDRSRSGSRASTNRDRIMCYMCREYDHLARDCPSSREERDLEQLQHILNMDEQDHTSPPAHSLDEDCRSPLNLCYQANV